MLQESSSTLPSQSSSALGSGRALGVTTLLAFKAEVYRRPMRSSRTMVLGLLIGLAACGVEDEEPIVVRGLRLCAGGGHACMINEDRSILCWGAGDADDPNGAYPHFGQAIPPEGEFAAVACGGGHTCALSLTGEAICWGDNGQGEAEPPPGAFVTLSAIGTQTCGLRPDGLAECWGSELAAHPPEGVQWRELGPGGPFCGIRVDGTGRCVDHNGRDEATPGGTLQQISAGNYHICALDTDGLLACTVTRGWLAGGPSDFGENVPPAGSFSEVSSGYEYSCALTMQGEAVCWGDNRRGECDAPPGEFHSLSAGAAHACAFSSDGRPVCWGSDLYDRVSSTP